MSANKDIPDGAFEVELFSTASSAVEATRATIEAMGACFMRTDDGRFYVLAPNSGYMRWAVIKQGYVRRIVEQMPHTTVSDIALVEEMAESAHEAWMAAQRSEGITSRKAAWGEEFMVPFVELSERGREFDRVIMRSILATFARRGLILVDAATLIE